MMETATPGRVLPGSLLAMLLVGWLAACGDQPTDVQVPTQPQFDGTDTTQQCVTINGTTICS